MSALQNVLAARKAQYATCLQTHLVGLRTGDEVDSDDDDDVGAAPAGGNTAVAQPTELLLSRAENLLRSPKVDERKKTITALEDAELSSEQLKPLLRALLLRFSDDSERCRDGAVGLFRRWQALCADASEVSGALPLLMPVMVERLGSEKVQEPAEEVRAALVLLMRDVLLTCRRLIRPYIAEVGAIALGCARDKHPDVIKGLCELMATVSADVLRPLVKETTAKQVKPFSTKLIEALLPHIQHRHAAVRLQVLCALEELLLCGAGQSVETLTGWRLKNNVPIAEFYGKGAPRLNYLADLSRDRSVQVRRKFIRVVARWAREMDGEDLYEQEVRIIPYLVSGLCDDDDVTATSAREEIERLGREHLEKNMNEYKERIEYGGHDERAATAAMTLPPPKPLPCRPPLGARERIRQHFRALIHPICAELEAWTSVERYQSARLLEVLLAYSEGSVTEFAHQLLPALAKGMDPDAPGLPDIVGRCAQQLSQHTHPDEYLPLLVGRANSDALNPLSQRISHLALVPHLLSGAQPHHRAPAVRALARLFADEPLNCTQHTPLRTAMRAALEAAYVATASAGGTGDSPADGAVLAALAPMLLRATALHLASAPALQPTVTSLGDGLEDISDADEAVWKAAADAAVTVVAPLSDARGESAWRVWRRAVLADLDANGAADDEFLPLASKLVHTVLAQLDAAPPTEPPTEPRTAPPAAPPAAAQCGGGTAGGTGAASESAPRRALLISEVDDFSDEDDDEAGGAAPAAGAAGEGEDLDEYDEAELD